MKELSSCKDAQNCCIDLKSFSIAHLYKEEKTLDMHIHNTYELYYSISGGRQFLINSHLYTIEPGDLFIINQYESHKITKIDQNVHERIVIPIYPEYLKNMSTDKTALDHCFTFRNEYTSNKIVLSTELQQRFLYYVNKITSNEGYGEDIVERCAFMELMILINKAFIKNTKKNSGNPYEEKNNTFQYNKMINDIFVYINENITNDITLKDLSGKFYISESYLCRIFKASTGTTITKYITARRINVAKSILQETHSINDAFIKSGFSDYSNFYKCFTKAVGVSPKKYIQFSNS